MSREEAIELLDNLIGMVEDNHNSDYDTAFKMAIKALEQESCEDTISRQAVLNLIEHYNSDGLGSVFYGYEEGVKFANAVNKLPPVNPHVSCEDAVSRQAVDTLVDELARAISDERCCISRGRSTATIMQDILELPPVNPQEPKTGHWIEDDMTYCGVDLTNYKCDKCGEIGGAWRKGLKPDKLPKYCMNCGAKMVEPQERSDKE